MTIIAALSFTLPALSAAAGSSGVEGQLDEYIHREMREDHLVGLSLAAEGKLSFGDRLDKYLEDAPDAWKGITIEELLTHTSGLRRSPTRSARGCCVKVFLKASFSPIPWGHAEGWRMLPSIYKAFNSAAREAPFG